MIKKTDVTVNFSNVGKMNMFSSNKTLHSRQSSHLWEGEDKEGESHFYQKIGKNKAITFDKRTVVHFLPHEIVNICTIENNVAL